MTLKSSNVLQKISNKYIIITWFSKIYQHIFTIHDNPKLLQIEKIYSGTGTEADLLDVLGEHDKSDYSHDKAQDFLETRGNEISAISLIMDEINKHNDIFTIKDQTNKDTGCIINSRLEVIHGS